jgi:murein DD-endopeptidase MepM/ murein hydrolase activator NlpD
MVLLFSIQGEGVGAATLTDQILDTRTKIQQLETEIANTQKDLGKVEKEASTLSNAVKTLDLNQKSLNTQTQVTQTKILNTSLSIADLEIKIKDKTEKIDKRTTDISSVLRNIQASSEETPAEMILSDLTLANKLDHIYTLERLQAKVRDQMIELRNERTDLATSKSELEGQRNKLVTLKSELVDKRSLVLSNKKQKETLLTVTKNKESTYKSLLEQKIALKAAFEKELADYEAKLKNADLGNVPSPGSGILKWPVDDHYITQYFGMTDFAKRTNAYNGKGHNGIDFRASMGSPLYSAASGVVKGTGNTDLGCPGGSYGKWVLITHNNGLSTLYAHMSLGQNVSERELIGYSGSTGYVTGPHLHFTVYASEGVRIDKLTKAGGTVSSCGDMPISPLNGYLNPLLYL